MRLRTILLLTLATVGTMFVASDAGALVLKSGDPKDGLAFAPPTFDNCIDCHDGSPINGGGGAMSITGVPGAYMAGATYSMSVTLDDPTALRWGFELVALDSAGNSAGTLTPSDANTQTSTTSGIDYLKQTSGGTFLFMSGPVTWNFDWTAPAAGAGTVFFYASGLAADADFGTKGDEVYSAATAATEGAADATLVLQPDVVNVPRSSTWNIRARIRDNSGAGNSVLLVSRVNLGGGNFFPASGWLLAPISASMVGDGQSEQVLAHPIAATTPLISATYEGFIGRAPSTLVDGDSFGFSIVP